MPANILDIRKADMDDVPAIRTLQERSLRVLGNGHYTPEEVALFIDRFGTMDFAVLEEDHFFLAADGSGRPVGTGGWSQRQPGYQGGQKALAAPDIATVRGVFVDPGATRRGIGSAIMRHVEADARAHGIRTLSLTATLSGIALYRALGYRERRRWTIELGGGLKFGCADMDKVVRTAAAA